MNCQDFDLYSIVYNQPIFDSTKGIFISTTNLSDQIINSQNMRLVSVGDNIIVTEFLYLSDVFYKFINNLDSYSREYILQKGEEWFSSSLNTDTINNMFKKSAQLPDYLPSFPSLAFHVVPETKVTSTRRKRMTLNDLKPNMEIEVHFTISGIYFYKNQCCLIYNITLIKVVNNVCQTLKNMFSDKPSINYIESETYDITASIYQ